MFKYYVEVTILKDDFSNYKSWRDLFAVLHGKFEKEIELYGVNKFAISLPNYDKGKRILGNTLRIFSRAKEELKTFDLKNTFNHNEEVFFITDIEEVPDCKLNYATYLKVSPKNPLQRAKRYSKRHNIPLEEAQKIYPYKQIDLPFVEMFSRREDKSHFYPLIINKIKQTNSVNLHEYNMGGYGLNKDIAVPEW